MKWNVYYHDSNANEIVVWNVFEHFKFSKELKDNLKDSPNKESFSIAARRTAQYYFWSKCEWEVIIAPWVGRNDTPEIKVDVYNQLCMNWEHFIEYVWSNKSELL